jgi:Tol biopolymer transport system component/predicted Ser/Thr protein kinase
MSTPLLSRRLGPYELVALIGKGGMGEVWRARDSRLGRDVAIKLSLEQFSDRFEREARAIAALNHPNICTLFDVGPNYLVLEYIEGENLKGPLPPDQVLEIATQIADALEGAHEKGIVHRDLKPANIKVRPDGSVKVLDFGLAKSGAQQAITSDSPTILSAAGMILGTAGYMSPEQARGQEVDKRADIFAFGVVLYEMLTGDRLFDGPTVTDTLASLLTREPDYEKIPARFRRLLRKCLVKDPKKRLRDIGDWTGYLEDSTTPAASPARTSTRLWFAATIAFSLITTALGVWIFLRPQPLPAVTRFQIFAPPGSTLPLATPAPSPDGGSIAYTVRGADGIVRIHVRALNSTESRALPGTERAIHLFWSPDGQSLVFTGDGNLKRVDLAGGPPRVLTPYTGTWHGAWNQFGIILFQMNGISQIAAAGGPATRVFPQNVNTGRAAVGFPAFLSDGKRFLARVEHADASNDIELFSLGSVQSKAVLTNVVSAPILAPTTRGTYLLYLREGSLMAQEFDEKAGRVRGNARVLVDSIGRVASPPVRPSVGVSPAGVVAWQNGSSEGGSLSWYERSGQISGGLASANVGSGGVRLSPDGRFAAFTSRFSGGAQNIWLADLTRGSSTRLTFDKYFDQNPVWSPDGKRLAFNRIGKGTYVEDISGAGEEKLVDRGALRPVGWTPDGQRILYNKGGENRLYLLPVDGTGTTVPVGSQGGVLGADLSPDGRYVAYFSAESGREEVYIEPLPPARGKWQVSVEGGSGPRWRRDGKELFFFSPDQKMMAVDIRADRKLSAGIPHGLFQSRSSDFAGRGYDVTADGQRFLVFSPGSGSVTDSPITVVLNWWAEFEVRK